MASFTILPQNESSEFSLIDSAISDIITLTILVLFGAKVINRYPDIIIITSLWLWVILAILYGSVKIVLFAVNCFREEYRSSESSKKDVILDFLCIGAMVVTLSFMGVETLSESFESVVTGFEPWMVTRVVVCCAYSVWIMAFAFRIATFLTLTMQSILSYCYPNYYHHEDSYNHFYMV